jgi:hypothetical protein
VSNESVPTTGGSSTGGHFIGSYQDCPRKWYLQYELDIKPKWTGKALTYGLAWHKAIEEFYRHNLEHSTDEGYTIGCSSQCGLEAGFAVLADAASHDRYQYLEDYETDCSRFPVMFSAWCVQIGTQILSQYRVLSLEETLSLELPNGFSFTGRLDELLCDRETGAVMISEHKSTSFSLSQMERSVFLGDQLPGYMALVKHCKPLIADKLQGCLLDVTYQRGKVVEARTSTLYYDASDLSRFLLNVTGVLNELSQKISAVREGVSDALLFPRNGLACSRFACPYEPICRCHADRSMDLPATLEHGKTAYDAEVKE